MATRPGRQGQLSIERIAKARKAGREVWLSDDDGFRGHGRLVIRINSKGAARFYFRSSNQRLRHAIALGRYSKNAKEGFLTLSQARAIARRLSLDVADRTLPATTSPFSSSKEQRAIERSQQPDQSAPAISEEENKVRAEATLAVAGTSLIDLSNAYVADLKARQKQSWKDSEGLVARHIAKTEWAAMPARLLTSQQASALLRAVVEAGKGRTAARVRSLLHAAFARAAGAAMDPTAGSLLIKFGVTSNPIAHVASLSQFNRTRQRSLNKTDLGKFWRAIQQGPAGEVSVPSRFLRVNLLLGGQRCEQLLRVKREHIDLEARFVQLLDPKGRRSEARIHDVPLSERAIAEVSALLQIAGDVGSDFLFPGRKPGTSLRSDFISKYVTSLSKHLELTAQVKRFQYADLRRTTETLMAGLKIPEEVRGRLLSHGLSGVQNRNYNRHEYEDEMRDALRQWEALLVSLEREEEP